MGRGAWPGECGRGGAAAGAAASGGRSRRGGPLSQQRLRVAHAALGIRSPRPAALVTRPRRPANALRPQAAARAAAGALAPRAALRRRLHQELGGGRGAEVAPPPVLRPPAGPRPGAEQQHDGERHAPQRQPPQRRQRQRQRQQHHASLNGRPPPRQDEAEDGGAASPGPGSAASAASAAADRIAASAALMDAIRRARSVAELAALHDAAHGAADHVHIAAWLGRLPHAQDLRYSQWPALDPCGAALLEQLLASFLRDLPRHRARQASNALWACGRLARGVAGSGAAAGAAAALVDALLLAPGALLLPAGGGGGGGSGGSGSGRRGGSGPNALDVANTAWALARLQAALGRRRADGGGGRGEQRHVEREEDEEGGPAMDFGEGQEEEDSSSGGSSDGSGSSKSRGGEDGGSGSDGQAAAAAPAAAANGPWASAAAWERLEAACLSQLPAAPPRELAAMLWAFAAARRPAPRLFAAAAPHVVRMGLQLDGTHISGIAWAYARQGYTCSTEGADSGGGGPESGPSPDEVARVFGVLSWRAAVNGPRFRGQALAVTLWALATARFAGDASGPAVLAAVAELRLRKFSGQGVSMLAHAAAALGLLAQRPGLVGALQREALFKMEEVQPLGVTHLLRALVAARRGGRGASPSGPAPPGGADVARQVRLAEDAVQKARAAGAASRRRRDRGDGGPGAGEAQAGAEVGGEAAVAAAVIDAVAAVAAGDARESPAARARAGAPPCPRLFLRELLRRAEALLPRTRPGTLAAQLAALAALREPEPRLLRAMAAAAAGHAAGGAYAAAGDACRVLGAFAALQQPCAPAWRALLPRLVAAAAAGGLAPGQLAHLVWAAAATPGVADAFDMRPALAALLSAAWAATGGGAADAGVLTRLAWASAVLLDAWAPSGSGGVSGVSRDGSAAAVDAAADTAAARLPRVLPQLAAAWLDAGTAGAEGPRSLEQRAEVLHAIRLWSAMQERQQQQQQGHQQAPDADTHAGQSVASPLARQARRLAEAAFDDLGARRPPPRALLLMLRAHGGGAGDGGCGLADARLAGAYAQEARAHLRAFGLQATLEVLQHLTGCAGPARGPAASHGGPGAVAGVAGVELAHAAAGELRARLPAATGGQLAAAVAAGCALPGSGGGGGLGADGARGGSGSSGGLVRAAAKLLLARSGECSAAEMLWAAGAAAGGGAGTGGAPPDAAPLVAALAAQAAGRAAEQPGAVPHLQRAQRGLARLQQQPPAAEATAAWREVRAALAAAQAACDAAPSGATAEPEAAHHAQRQDQPLPAASLQPVGGADGGAAAAALGMRGEAPPPEAAPTF
jgi:hypothetical protein